MTATDWAGVASDIGAEVTAERERAATKHGDTSMEAQPWDAPIRLAVLAEEVGEAADEIATYGPAAKGRQMDQARSVLLTAAQGRVAKTLNDARHEQRPIDPGALRRALREVGSIALTWAALTPAGSPLRHELVQVVAMATSWLNACPDAPTDAEPPADPTPEVPIVNDDATPPPAPLDSAMLETTVRLAAAQWGAPAVARAAARFLGDGVALLDLGFAGIPLYVDVVGAPATEGVALAACSLTVEFSDGKGVTVAGVALVVDDEPLYFHETEPMPDPDGAERLLLAVHAPRLDGWRTVKWNTLAAGLRRSTDPDPATALVPEPADREDVRA